jgi:hypothetical protein
VSVIPALRRLWKKDCEFKASQGYTMKTYVKDQERDGGGGRREREKQETETERRKKREKINSASQSNFKTGSLW